MSLSRYGHHIAKNCNKFDCCVANLTHVICHNSVWNNMMTSSNGNITALLALCAGYSPVTGEVPSQRPVMRSFDVFCELRLNKRLSKQSWGWWFETPLRSFLRHCNETNIRMPHGQRISIIHSIERNCSLCGIHFKNGISHHSHPVGNASPYYI